MHAVVYRLPLVALVAGLAAAVACSDSKGPSVPSQVQRVGGDGQQGQVARALPQPLAVRVLDSDGRAVSGIRVNWQATAGGGTLSPASTETDGSGEARATWTLGTTAGPQTATATAEGLAPVAFSATATPGGAVALEKVAGDQQEGLAGQPLPQQITVRIADAHGNPLPNSPIEWRVVLGGGSVSPATSAADASGEARTTWTLGPSMGDQILTAEALDLEPATFRARLRIGEPATVEFPVESFRLSVGNSTRLAVAVKDSVGNSIPNASIEWTTSDASVATVDGTGLITAVREGIAWIRAQSGSAQDSVRVEGIDGPTLNFTVDNFYLTQSIQTYEGSVPLVEGRPALLRVFVVANEMNLARPFVRVRLYHDGSLAQTFDIQATGEAVPTTVNERLLGHSWNVKLDGDRIRPGLGVAVEVNPDAALPEADDSDNRLPVTGEPRPITVEPAPPFRIRFVPVHQSSTGRTGNVNAGNVDEFMDRVNRMFPLPGYDADVRATYTTNTPPLQSNDGNNAWRDILGEMSALRVAEATGRYYHGIVNPSYGPGIWGMAFTPGRVGLSVDRLAQGASNVVAHELGHNFGRSHAPCRPGGGLPEGVDPNFPDPNALIGAFGYDMVADAVREPTDRDIMSYCYEWISPYTFQGAMNHRAQNDWPQGSASSASQQASILVVWGRANARELVLEPAFDAVARPVLPSRGGPYRIEGLGEAGEVLFAYDFEGEAVAHAAEDDRHFGFGIPLTPQGRARLARIRLTGPTARGTESVVRTRGDLRLQAVPGPDPAAVPDPEPVILPRAPEGVVVRWDAEVYPLVVVRDPRTGEILSLARGGEAPVVTDARELDLDFSDGVRGTPRRVIVPGR